MKIIIVLFFLIFSSCLCYSQVYEYGQPCKKFGTPEIKKTLQKGFLKNIEFNQLSLYYHNYDIWSTSFLKPSGKAPKIIGGEEDPLNESEYAYHRWTCMYSAKSAMDGDPKTAWATGKNGGIGEILIVDVDINKPVKFWSGYGKSKNLFLANNRPKKIHIYVIKGVGGAGGGVGIFKNLKVIDKIKFVLKDLNDYQELPLPKYKAKGDSRKEKEGPYVDVSFLAIEIVTVYKGNKYNDVCISEVKN